MESEETGIQFPDVASIAGEVIQGVPGYAVPAGGVEPGAVEGEQLGAAAGCQLVYPVSEGLTLMWRCGLKELKQQPAGIPKGCTLSQNTMPVMGWCAGKLAIFAVTVCVDGFHAAAYACEVGVEAVWEIFVTCI